MEYQRAYSLQSGMESGSPVASQTCKFCGKKFHQRACFDRGRLELHLAFAHSFGACNSSRKFYRIDRFRQHLQRNHKSSEGDWLRALEETCEEKEPRFDDFLVPEGSSSNCLEDAEARELEIEPPTSTVAIVQEDGPICREDPSPSKLWWQAEFESQTSRVYRLEASFRDTLEILRGAPEDLVPGGAAKYYYGSLRLLAQLISFQLQSLQHYEEGGFDLQELSQMASEKRPTHSILTNLSHQTLSKRIELVFFGEKASNRKGRLQRCGPTTNRYVLEIIGK